MCPILETSAIVVPGERGVVYEVGYAIADGKKQDEQVSGDFKLVSLMTNGVAVSRRHMDLHERYEFLWHVG